MSPCHNLEPSLVARDSSRLLSVKPNEWMHLSPFYTRMHGEWLRYAKSTSQFHWRFLLVRDVRGFQVNPLCRHDITSPFPPSGNGGYVRNLDGIATHREPMRVHRAYNIKLVCGPRPWLDFYMKSKQANNKQAQSSQETKRVQIIIYTDNCVCMCCTYCHT